MGVTTQLFSMHLKSKKYKPSYWLHARTAPKVCLRTEHVKACDTAAHGPYATDADFSSHLPSLLYLLPFLWHDPGLPFPDAVLRDWRCTSSLLGRLFWPLAVGQLLAASYPWAEGFSSTFYYFTSLYFNLSVFLSPIDFLCICLSVLSIFLYYHSVYRICLSVPSIFLSYLSVYPFCLSVLYIYICLTYRSVFSVCLSFHTPLNALCTIGMVTIFEYSYKVLN